MNFSEIGSSLLTKVLGKVTQQYAPETNEPGIFKTILLRARLNRVNSWINLLGGQETSSSQFDLYKEYRLMLDQMILEKMNSEPSPVLSNANRSKVLGMYEQQSANPIKNEAASPESTQIKSGLRQLARRTARTHGIPESWFEKLIALESNFDPFAISAKGAMGLGQLMPETARELGLQLTPLKEDRQNSVWNPVSNLDASARYLHRLHEHFIQRGMEGQEAWNFAAGAYNAGIGNIEEALARVNNLDNLIWDKVAEVLPQVTGTSSLETLKYVENLRS